MKSFFTIFIVALFCQFAEAHNKKSVTLADCGAIVGHEMGLWDFFSTSPSPAQVDRVKESALKFVKVSLQKLKDDSWVVAHDDGQVIVHRGGKAEYVQFADITWADVKLLKDEGGNIVPIYNIADYVQRDGHQLCWMFTPKEAVNQTLINTLMSLSLLQRSVITTNSLEDVAFLETLPEGFAINYTGRVNSLDTFSQLDAIKPRLYAVEVDHNDVTLSVVAEAKKRGYKIYLDSMPYDNWYELFDSACQKAFADGADVTQTNRPLRCMKIMNSSQGNQTPLMATRALR